MPSESIDFSNKNSRRPRRQEFKDAAPDKNEEEKVIVRVIDGRKSQLIK